MSVKTVLVTGASGYIGARLVGYLLAEGYNVRAAARSIGSLQKRPWINDPNVQATEMDVFDLTSVQKACEGCEAVYYLIHSMNRTHKDFADADRVAARNMIKSTEKAGVRRIIYLGGLGESDISLSPHLKSRHEVSQILHSGKTPATTLRAAMIMGNGSVSFEILAYLVRRLPIMITPRWVVTESQPIAIRNVIEYLVGCLKNDQTAGEIFDIGGPDILSYEQLMRLYASEAGLAKRIIVHVPILTPRLSSYWIDLVTPIDAALARPLTEGLRNRVVCQENRIRTLIPQNLISCRQVIRMILNLEANEGYKLPQSQIKLPPVESVYPGDAPWSGVSLKK